MSRLTPVKERMASLTDDQGQLHSPDEATPALQTGKQKRWYRHGVLHRTTGPAVIGADGYEEYRLFGRHLRKMEWEFLRDSGLDLNCERSLSELAKLSENHARLFARSGA